MAVKIVFEHNGEFKHTERYPISTLEEFKGDINEKKECLYNYDFYMPVEVLKYQVKEVEIPEWMTTYQYCKNYIQIKDLMDQGLSLIEIDSNIFEGIIRYTGKERSAIVSLFKSNNTFKESLKNQFIEWCVEKKYKSPFSQKQWECILKYK